MVMECGMSDEIGPVYVPADKSGQMRKAVDSEVARMLRDANSRVTAMLVSTALPPRLQSTPTRGENPCKGR